MSPRALPPEKVQLSVTLEQCDEIRRRLGNMKEALHFLGKELPPTTPGAITQLEREYNDACYHLGKLALAVDALPGGRQ